MNIHPLQILELRQQRNSSQVWITNQDNISRLLEPIMDMPVSVISIIGPPSKGKSILFANIASYLESIETKQENWEASKNLIPQTTWPEGDDTFKAPSIWSYHRHFVIPNGSGPKSEEIAVLIFYTHSFDDSDWENDNNDICALLGLTLAISTSTIVNVYKHLNEDCISALSMYLKFAVEGAKSKSNDLRKLTASPIQNMTIVIRDWNFPFEEDFHGRNGGHNFVKRKLELKQGQSRYSRQSRQLISGLVKNVSGWLLPFPGNQFIEQPYTNGVINEGNKRFELFLKSFVHQAVRTDMLEIKTDVYGNMVNGRILLDLINRYIAGVNTMRAKALKPATVFRWMGKQLHIDSDEQEDCIPTALRAYSEAWRTKRRNLPFLDERTLMNTHEAARKKAETAFEREVNQVDDEDEDDEGYMDVRINKYVFGLLKERIEACFETIRTDNFNRKLEVMNDRMYETVQSYRNKMSSLYRAETMGLEENYVVGHSKEMIRASVKDFRREFTTQSGAFELQEDVEAIIDKLKELLEKEQKALLDKLFVHRYNQY